MQTETKTHWVFWLALRFFNSSQNCKFKFLVTFLELAYSFGASKII
jgi:hypothetical protein